VHSFLRPLSFLREVPAASVYETGICCGTDNRHTIFADPLPVLFCGGGKISGRRHPPGRQRYETVYGRHFHRPDPAGGTGIPSFRMDPVSHRHMVRMADRMDRRHDAVGLLLSKGIKEINRIVAEFIYDRVPH